MLDNLCYGYVDEQRERSEPIVSKMKILSESIHMSHRQKQDTV